MCSVTFWPRGDGYLAGMNRDEQRTRAAGLAPQRVRVGEGWALRPTEPDGGTWISVQESGVTLALLNGAAPTTAIADRLSRGTVIPAVAAGTTIGEVAALLGRLELARFPAFRLVGVFPRDRRVMEWSWDRRRLWVEPGDWQPRVWISSGFDEPSAQRWRGEAFARALQDEDAGSVGWLRRLHAGHAPERGPFSVCMHRPDARTVSYTEVDVGRDQGEMRHLGDSPCRARGEAMQGLSLDRRRHPREEVARSGQVGGLES